LDQCLFQTMSLDSCLRILRCFYSVYQRHKYETKYVCHQTNSSRDYYLIWKVSITNKYTRAVQKVRRLWLYCSHLLNCVNDFTRDRYGNMSLINSDKINTICSQITILWQLQFTTGTQSRTNIYTFKSKVLTAIFFVWNIIL
jgi:hypothetical protein